MFISNTENLPANTNPNIFLNRTIVGNKTKMNKTKLLLSDDFTIAFISLNLLVAKKLEAFTNSRLIKGEFVIRNIIFKILSV